MIKFLSQEKKIQDSEDELNKQLNMQHAQIFKLMEDIREINQKIDKIQTFLEGTPQQQKQQEEVILDPKEITLTTKKDKTKDAIKLILKRKGKLTSDDMCKIIGLSRTRCNEYLKELEMGKEAKAEIVGRKKFYKIV